MFEVPVISAGSFECAQQSVKDPVVLRTAVKRRAATQAAPASRVLTAPQAAADQSTKITLTSLTLVRVGPVSSRSPVAVKNAVASLLAR